MLNSFFLKFELRLLKFELNSNFLYAAAALPLNPGPSHSTTYVTQKSQRFRSASHTPTAVHHCSCPLMFLWYR